MDKKDFLALFNSNKNEAEDQVISLNAEEFMELFAGFSDEKESDPWVALNTVRKNRITALNGNITTLTENDLDQLEVLLGEENGLDGFDISAIRSSIDERRTKLASEIDENRRYTVASDELFGLDGQLKDVDVINSNLSKLDSMPKTEQILSEPDFSYIKEIFNNLTVVDENGEKIPQDNENSDVALFCEQVRHETEMFLSNTSSTPITPEVFKQEFKIRLQLNFLQLVAADSASSNLTKKQIEQKFLELTEGTTSVKISQETFYGWQASRQTLIETKANKLLHKYPTVKKSLIQRIKTFDTKLKEKYGEPYSFLKNMLKTAGWSAAYAAAAPFPGGIAAVATLKLVDSYRSMRKEYEKQKQQASLRGELLTVAGYLKKNKTQVVGVTLTAIGGAIGLSGGSPVASALKSGASMMLATVTTAKGAIEAWKKTKGPWYKKLYASSKVVGASVASFVVGSLAGKVFTPETTTLNEHTNPLDKTENTQPAVENAVETPQEETIVVKEASTVEEQHYEDHSAQIQKNLPNNDQLVQEDINVVHQDNQGIVLDDDVQNLGEDSNVDSEISGDPHLEEAELPQDPLGGGQDLGENPDVYSEISRDTPFEETELPQKPLGGGQDLGENPNVDSEISGDPHLKEEFLQDSLEKQDSGENSNSDSEILGDPHLEEEVTQQPLSEQDLKKDSSEESSGVDNPISRDDDGENIPKEGETEGEKILEGSKPEEEKSLEEKSEEGKTLGEGLSESGVHTLESPYGSISYSLSDEGKSMRIASSLTIDSSQLEEIKGEVFKDADGVIHAPNGYSSDRPNEFNSSQNTYLLDVLGKDCVYKDLEARAAAGEILGDAEKNFMANHEKLFNEHRLVRDADGSVREPSLAERIIDPKIRVKEGVITVKGHDADGHEIKCSLAESGMRLNTYVDDKFQTEQHGSNHVGKLAYEHLKDVYEQQHSQENGHGHSFFDRLRGIGKNHSTDAQTSGDHVKTSGGNNSASHTYDKGSISR